MKKLISLILISILVIVSLAGCGDKYNEKDFIGKTSAEIEAEYGKFDCVMMPPDNDGLYRNCRCGYTIKEPRVGFLGTDPEVLFFISFDKNGVAYECGEDYRPGG